MIFDAFFKEPETESTSTEAQVTHQEQQPSYIGSLLHFLFDRNENQRKGKIGRKISSDSDLDSSQEEIEA